MSYDIPATSELQQHNKSLSFKDRLNNIDPLEIKSVPIIHNNTLIYRPSEEATIDEAEKLWPILEASLDPKIGYGLAAVQIGILKKIAFIRYNGEEYRLLNTRITDRTGIIPLYGEGCLSLPGKVFNTIRSQQITVEDDVLGRFVLDESTSGLLTLIFQHEVDHFEGLTLKDRQRKPIKHIESKVGRNESCPCGSGKKYKKCCGN